jgi:dGTPase
VLDIGEHSERAGEIVQGPEAGAAMSALRDFMFEQVYLGPAVRAEHARIAGVVRRLFEHYVEHPELLPGDPEPSSGVLGDVDLAQRVTEYLAGMTDRYCIREYTELQVPQAFAR